VSRCGAVFRAAFVSFGGGDKVEERIAALREKAHALPESPGVYLMKDETGKIIYVGKAKVLRNRVSSYFVGIERHMAKVRRMVEHVADFDYLVCGSEMEALVLECSQIKHLEAEMRHFLECIETGKTPLTDGRSSLQSLRVIWRLYEAEEQGTVADLRGLGLDAPCS
jgi:predicted dehydrogenase